MGSRERRRALDAVGGSKPQLATIVFDCSIGWSEVMQYENQVEVGVCLTHCSDSIRQVAQE
jgi:hypothetical protein